MTYKLYNRTGSGGFAVEAALALCAQPFELVDVDSPPSTPLPESFREINRWRQVPVLILPDGTTLTETAAILVHLSVVHPEHRLGPLPATPAFATMLRWLFFMGCNIYEGILRSEYPHRFTLDSEGCKGVADSAIGRTHEAFLVIENELERGAFLLGSEMSVTDVYLGMLYSWHIETDACPKCEALTHRVAGHPIIAPIWQRNFDHRTKRRWGRES